MRKRTNHNKIVHQNNLHLSIQFSLDGFSFCVLNEDNEVVIATKYDFLERCSTPQELLSRIKDIFEKNSDLHFDFTKIKVVHRNSLNTIVPKNYFYKDRLKSYLNFTVKTFESDYITYDVVGELDINNIYIPFVNINNYLLDHFGDFDFYHHHSVWLEKLQKDHLSEATTVFVNVDQSLLDITVFDHKKLILNNSFEVNSAEDFTYFLLFVYEQLKLDPNQVETQLFGMISEHSPEYQLAFKYIKNIQILDIEQFGINKADFNSTEFYLIS